MGEVLEGIQVEGKHEPSRRERIAIAKRHRDIEVEAAWASDWVGGDAHGFRKSLLTPFHCKIQKDSSHTLHDSFEMPPVLEGGIMDRLSSRFLPEYRHQSLLPTQYAQAECEVRQAV